MLPAILIAAVPILVLTLLIWRRLTRNARRKRLLAQPIPAPWRVILERRVPLYERLPAPLRDQLDGRVNVFIAEKTFVGCGGQEITDEVKVTVAGQACILLLNREPRFFPRLHTIYVYPATYIARPPTGNRSAEGQPRLGESWQNGPVVLAWNSVTGGANNIHDGQNVVFHEFAHRLDQEDGVADGAPILESRSCYATWARVLSGEYEALQSKTKKRKKSVLNRYGATDPAEFFAVATEAFLEKPKQMKRKQPELYEELKRYYRIDPAEWLRRK